ncbi:vps16 [Candida jiufengensis]|uniref:vps16 n=1 Tax=Candida jiufengensis TaxID=497108 RepID=UPI00222553BD|nr:vps16 [Candida jiufengensis]KAI5953525.1 vps16 [Candida jiufengensis]
MPTNPSYNWSRLQNVYYDIRTCYNPLNWSIDKIHSNFRISFSLNSTLIALASKNIPYPNLIDIYSISGNKIWSIVYNSTQTNYIFGFYFKNEDLILLLNNGKYRYYQDLEGNFNEYQFNTETIVLDNMSPNGTSNSDDLNANELHSSRMITNLENNETEEITNIIEALVYQQYLIVRLENKIIITDLNTYQNFEINISQYLPNDIEGIAVHKEKNSEKLHIYLAWKNTIILINIDFGLSNFEILDQELTDGPFSSISISENGQLISLHNDTLRKIFVVSSAFDQILLEYDTSNESSSPYQVEWCGNDAIVLSFKDEIKLIGPGQQSISFFYDIDDEDEFDLDNLLLKNSTKDDLSYTIPILHHLPDGIRILTGDKCQFLSRVPEKTVEMYQIGSNSPSGLLADCIDKFELNASKANANINFLKNDDLLNTAMADCLDVALYEFDPVWQKRALRAVSFGKIYDTDAEFDSNKYLKVLNIIRVLNQIRSPEIGIFLTYQEIELIGWEEVIKMLLRRNQHYLALKIIDNLELNNILPLVYIHYCCSLIRKESSSSDSELYKSIVKKLVSIRNDKSNYITTSDIVGIADEEGRVELRNLLINLEPSITKKIYEYISYDEPELALIKSFQFGDHDLSVLILLYLQETSSTSDFFKILNQNEIQNKSINQIADKNIDIRTENIPVEGDVIGHTWLTSLGESNLKLMEKFLSHQDKSNEINLYNLKQFKKSHPNPEGEDYYNQYKKLLQRLLKNSTNHTSVKSFQRELDLLEKQKKLEEIYSRNFYQYNSVSSTLKQLITMHQIKPASKLVKEFQMGQEKFWYLVLSTYSKSKEFNKLYEFVFGSMDSTTAKSPIGFEPFIDAGFEYNFPQKHISIYISNSVKYKYDEKVRLFIRNNDYEMAAQEAFKNKDIDILRNLKKTISNSNSNAAGIIDGYIKKLGY